ncbi:hypothetical protein Poli38472_014689 [Pythium oligandrum]|uniref:ZZ-type domain-containing protein n=1 Tax=Pythium oligandrum TaxID=41045 RepID=A0A8K1CI36_PYTOL|nr:hypothetical protein Poli38472_014689 [Pythium oligandrum]|eukprot:TMW63984.1 hypothetical protein Poli38472_014689 [Pythium oligandrum]
MAATATALHASSNAQHNLAALQTQLQTLQLQNAALTKELSVKESHVQRKEQQFRVLQQRMDELELNVALWKEKYREQLTVNSAMTTAKAQMGQAQEHAAWSTYALPASGNDADTEQVAALVDRLSMTDRDRLKTLLAMDKDTMGWSEVFTDVSDELLQVLLQYLVPVLQDAQQRANETKDGNDALTIQCLQRTYTKTATDFRIVCLTQERASAQATAAAAVPRESPTNRMTIAPAASPTSGASTLSSPPTSGDRWSQASMTIERMSSAAMAAALPITTPPPRPSIVKQQEEHLFDCIDCENPKRNPPVPHGPRQIHPHKAVYISRPLHSPVPSPSASSPRRFSTRISSGHHADSASRTSTMPSRSSATGYDGIDGDRRSGTTHGSLTGAPPLGREGSGKIKKIMGNMMKGLHRHKPQLTTAHPQMDEDDSVCDGCGRGPITGYKWVCRTCKLHKDQEYELCEKCYGQGLHGKENEDALLERVEEIVVAKCPKLVHEHDLMRLLRVGICKANLKKYSFCLTWIADLLQCKQTKDLRARALEISQISPQVRSEFVRLLKDLLTKYRRDIELLTEWKPAQNVSVGTSGLEDGAGGLIQLDTLRIWVKDVVTADNRFSLLAQVGQADVWLQVREMGTETRS